MFRYLLFNTTPASVTFDPNTIGIGSILTNGNLTTSKTSGAYGTTRITSAKSIGKWYAEFYINSGSTGLCVGLVTPTNVLETQLGSTVDSWAYFADVAGTGYKRHFPGGFVNYASPSGTTYSTGDTIGMALNMDAGEMTIYKNNTSLGIFFNGLTGSIYMAVNGYDGPATQITGRFLQTSWLYTPPTGFIELTP